MMMEEMAEDSPPPCVRSSVLFEASDEEKEMMGVIVAVKWLLGS
jgi:hypothetical protein